MLHIPSKPPQFRSADLLQNYPLFASNAGFNLIEGPSNETLVTLSYSACCISDHVRIAYLFFSQCLHETCLTMNSDRSDFVSVAGSRREILVPV